MTLAVPLVAAVVGAAIAIWAGFLNARRAGLQAPQSPASAFVAAALFAAMMGAMIYQGVSNSFPPAFLGAGVFLAGTVIALWWGLRRPQA